jgi:hypothetical protein
MIKVMDCLLILMALVVAFAFGVAFERPKPTGYTVENTEYQSASEQIKNLGTSKQYMLKTPVYE